MSNRFYELMVQQNISFATGILDETSRNGTVEKEIFGSPETQLAFSVLDMDKKSVNYILLHLATAS